MNEIAVNDPWIMAQIVRIRRGLEAEIKDLLAISKPSGSALSVRMEQLKVQLTLLDLSLG